MVKKQILLTLAALLCMCASIVSQGVDDFNGLPYPSFQYQEVGDQVDPVLQRNLELMISKNPQWQILASQKRLAIGLVDIKDSENIRYASINGKHMMYAASLPKIAVLLAAIQSVEEGCLVYDDALKSDLRLMIAKSNNAATTRVIERLGFDKIASVLRDDEYDLYDRKEGGGLWVGKKYAKSGKKKPDPLKGISHAATVEQVCRYYTMLAYGKLVSEEYSREMMKYLIDPEINHKFVKTLHQIAPDADLYRKSGSWRAYHSDSVLVYGEGGRKYILVALIEDAGGGKICCDLVGEIENALGIDAGYIPVQPRPNGPVVKVASGD